MIKGRLKYINKVMGFFITLSMFIGMFTTTVYAASFSLTSNRTSVTPNSTFKVTISAEGAGKFNISVSNGSTPDASIWVDGSETFEVTAKNAGTTKVTVKAEDAYSWSEEPITGDKTIEIKVAKASKPSSSDNGSSSLTIQIAIAEKLKRGDYTDESWDLLQDALKKAKSAKNSDDPDKMNQAANDLKLAIDSLVKIDHSRLQNAINQAKSLLEKDDANLWVELAHVLDLYEGMLSSTNQQDVDIATDKILEVLEKINLALNTQGELGEDNFCNIPMHTIWTILFFISFGINITVGYMLVKNTKRRFNDDIPVVDYDIDDDNV